MSSTAERQARIEKANRIKELEAELGMLKTGAVKGEGGGRFRLLAGLHECNDPNGEIDDAGKIKTVTYGIGDEVHSDTDLVAKFGSQKWMRISVYENRVPVEPHPKLTPINEPKLTNTPPTNANLLNTAETAKVDAPADAAGAHKKK